jgi:O-antigen ligase
LDSADQKTGLWVSEPRTFSLGNPLSPERFGSLSGIGEAITKVGYPHETRKSQMINALKRATPHQAIITIIALGIIIVVIGSSLLALLSPVEASILFVAASVGLVIIWRPEIGFLLMIASLGFENIVIGVSVTIFRMIGVLTFGSWFSRELLAQRVLFTKTPQNLYIAGFIFTGTLSLFFADELPAGLMRVATFTQLFFLYLLVGSIVNTERKLKQVVWMWVIGATAASLFTIAMFIWKELPRAVGGIQDSNNLVLALLIPIALAICLFQIEKTALRKVFLGISSALFLLVTVISFSRGGFIAVIVVLGLSFLKSQKKSVLVALLLAISIGALTLPSSVLPLQAWFDRLSIGAALESAGAGRFYIWQGGVAMFLNSPILGVGVANFEYEYERYTPWHPLVTGKKVAHNAYLEIAVEQGFFGLLFFLLLLWITYRDLRKASRFMKGDESDFITHISQALLIGFLGCLVGVMFLSQQQNKNLWLVVGLAVAIKLLNNRRKQQTHTSINSIAGNVKE